MAKKAALTGTQKKAQKQLAHELRKQAPTRAKGVRKEESYLHGGRRYEATKGELKSYLKDLKKELGSKEYKNLEQFLPGGKAYKGAEDFKGLRPFEFGGKAYEKPDFYREGKEGLKMAERVLEPIQKQALRDYSLTTIPGVVSQYGGESKSSSALNQALAASKQNLMGQLHAQTAGLAAQYGSDISRMNLAERGRQQQLQQGTALDRARLNAAQQAQQQGLQYGAASDIFGAQRAATLGLNEQQRANLQYLNSLNLGTAQHLQGSGLGGIGGAFQPNYLQSQQQPSPWGSIFGGLAQGAGTAGGAYALASLLPAAASSQEIKENIKDYEKGLDIIHDLDVKQYDYTIPVQGAQKDRIGLIAENVPEEIRTMIGPINAVDVYGLVSILVNCVKQLDNKVKILESKVQS